MASALIIWISRARVVAITAVLVLAAIVTALSVQQVIDDSDAFAVQHTVLRPISTVPVWDAIADRDLGATYAEYWLAYRLVFQDRRDVVVIPTSYDYYDLGGKNPQGADAAFFYGGSLCFVSWLEVLKGIDVDATTEPVGDYVLVRTAQPVPVAMVAAAMGARCGDLPG
jgi:hypothetical protein